MKLALFVGALNLGGAEIAAINLASQAAAEGIEVDVVAAKPYGVLERRVTAPINLVGLDSTRSMTAIPSFAKYLRRSRPDGIISFMDHVNVAALLAARLSGTKPSVCVTVHSPYEFTLERMAFTKRRVLGALVRRCYPGADSVVCVSGGVKASLLKFLRRDALSNVHVIYNPVIAVMPIRPHTPVDRKRWRFIFVGRLAPEKGLQTLLDAFVRVSKVVDAHLCIYGDGPMRNELKGSIDRANLQSSVFLMGYVADPPDIYGQADCLVLTSTYESFGNVLIEALSFGCAVISTDCPVGPRELLEGGRWGTLVPVGDSEALAAAMINVATRGTSTDTDALHAYLRAFRAKTVLAAYLESMGLRDRLAGES